MSRAPAARPRWRARRAPSLTATPSRSAMPAPVRRPIRSIRNCRSRRNPLCRLRWSRRPSASSRCARIFRRRTCRNSSPTRRSNPGKVNLGHAGVGSSNFLICKSFVQAAGIDVTLVGYRGAAPALTDAIGGQIDGVCDCRRLGVAGDRRQAGEGPRGRLDGAACDACPICRRRPKQAFPISRRRAGTACSRRRARRLRSSRN